MQNLLNIYDLVTGEFMGIEAARQSPLEPNVYLSPSNGTFKSLPDEIPVGYVAVFDKSIEDWTVKQDRRGEIWYTQDGEKVELTSILFELAADWSQTPPAIPVEEIMKKAVNEVKQALQSTIDAKAQGFGFSGGNALMLYAGFTNAFQPLAQTFATWEASVWVEAEAYKTQVIAGNQPMLSPEEAVAMMPVYPT